MHAALDELTVTPARSLYDFGVKARELREFQNHIWFDPGAEGELDRGELLARAMTVELMEISNLSLIRQLEDRPQDHLAGFVEPPAMVLAQTEPLVAETPAIACIAAELGARFKSQVDAWNAIDNAPRTGSSLRDRAVSEGVDQRLEGLADAICFVEASSPLGVLAQLCIACGSAGALDNLVGEDDRANGEHHGRRVQAALWSIRDFFERTFGIDARDVGAEYNMPVGLRPLAELSEQDRSAA